MSKLKIDQTTGEILQVEIMIDADKAPAVVLDVSEVVAYHNDPKALADKIRQQAGFMVFDIGTQKGRDACRAHAANIIRCIAPAAKASQALAETAKQVVKQDLQFRKVFDEEVRAIAAFHRKPLTEYEEAVERQKEADRLAEEARLAEEKYLSDWQQAIDYDELFTLRREKERREEEDRNRAIAEDIANKKAWAKENADGYQFLFADIAQLVTKPMEEFQSVILSRLELHKKTEVEREEQIRKEAADKARREEQQRIAAEQAANKMAEEQAKAEQAYREKLERENQEELEHAAQKAKQERVVGVVDTGEQDSGYQAQIVQAINIPDNKEQDKQARPVDDPAEKSPPRDQIIKAVAAKFFVPFDVAETWCIKEFGESQVRRQEDE